MINNNNKAPEFTKKQKLLIIPLAFYVIGMIIYLCYDAEHTESLNARRIHALIAAAPFIIYTIATFIIEFIVPDRQLIVTNTQKKFWYLTNYDYKVGQIIHRKERNLTEIYFDNDDLLQFCVIYFYKPKLRIVYFSDKPSEDGSREWENVFWLELFLTGNYKSGSIISDEDEKNSICAVIEEIKKNKERVSQVIDWLYNPKSGNTDEVYKLIAQKELPDSPVSEIMEEGFFNEIINYPLMKSSSLEEQQEFLLRLLQLLPPEMIISFLLKVDSLIKTCDSDTEKSNLENFLYPANAAFTLSTGKKIEDYIDFSALED